MAKRQKGRRENEEHQAGDINETKSVKVAKGNTSSADELVENRWTHKVSDSESGSDYASEHEMDGDCEGLHGSESEERESRNALGFKINKSPFLITNAKDTF